MTSWRHLRTLGELVARSGFSLSVSADVIELRRGASPGPVAGRLVLGLFLLPFALFPPLLLLEPEIPTRLPAVLFYVLWYGFLAGFAGLAGAMLFRWRLVRFDAHRGRLELRGAGRFLWLPRRESVSLDRIREIRLLLGPEGLRPLPFTWVIEYDVRGRGRRTAWVGATVDAIDRREEALDLTVRVARLLGWKALETGRRDHLMLEVRLARSGMELEDPRPIPRLDEPPDYDGGLIDGELLGAEPEVPPFDPAAYGGPEEIVTWEPGRRVELAVRPFTVRQRILAVVMAALFFGAPIAVFLWAISLVLPAPARPWLVLGLVQSILTAAGVTAFIVWRARQVRRVALDWSRGRLTLEGGGKKRSARLEEIGAIEVRGTRSAGGAGREGAPRFRCEVVARLEGPHGAPAARAGRSARAGPSGREGEIAGGPGVAEIRLLDTGARRDPTRPYRDATGFASEVAAALDVPWRWSGYPRGS